jgi:hypothetical protein
MLSRSVNRFHQPGGYSAGRRIVDDLFQFVTLCPDAHAAPETWQSSIRFSDALNGRSWRHDRPFGSAGRLSLRGRTLPIPQARHRPADGAASRGSVTNLFCCEVQTYELISGRHGYLT